MSYYSLYDILYNYILDSPLPTISKLEEDYLELIIHVSIVIEYLKSEKNSIVEGL